MIIRKNYEREWGDLLVAGKKTFYYYNNLELGDTTFFTKIMKEGKNVGIDTMSDVGFGLERIRWCLNGGSYYNLYSNSKNIDAEIKAYLSAIALLTVNGVQPTNKNAGYRARMFSKKLASLLNGKELNDQMQNYLLECVKYWKDWQEIDKEINLEIINKEYVRNCNRYILDKLISQGYENINGININISRDELKKRLVCSGLENEKVDELFNNKLQSSKKAYEEDWER